MDLTKLMGVGTSQFRLPVTLDSRYPSQRSRDQWAILNFRMAYAVVPMLLNIVICWIWLQVYYLGFPFGKIANFFRRKKSRNDDEDKPAENPDRIRELLRSQYNDLGFMTFHEIAVLMLFIFLVLLWFFREPEFMPGWGEFFPIK